MNISAYNQKQKIKAVLICLLIAAVMLLSSLYVLIHADHDCSGTDCTVCMNIQQCENNIKMIFSGIAVGQIITSAAFVFVLIVLFYTVCASVQTPVDQKVRMND
ncbi:MAG: hypothetical protein IJ192_03770 [Clostridia bacterium]|nr:hypothetical protein [Clostridia bacterium]MBR2175811.1 hypothetical protein [Clostridia bacterium]